MNHGHALQLDIDARLRLLVCAVTPEKRRFPTLEEKTSVKENTWRTWWVKGKTPGGALIEGAARAWPEYAFWLVSGLTDGEYGHGRPGDKIDEYASEYFKVCGFLQKSARTAPPEVELLENLRRFLAQKRMEVAARTGSPT
jgi:hypothetical protein